jgi:hypothetical protein
MDVGEKVKRRIGTIKKELKINSNSNSKYRRNNLSEYRTASAASNFEFGIMRIQVSKW